MIMKDGVPSVLWMMTSCGVPPADRMMMNDGGPSADWMMMDVGVVSADWMAIMKVHDRTISGVFNISIFAPSPSDFPFVRNPGVDIIRFHRLKVRP